MKSTSSFLRQLGFTGPGVLVNENQARLNIRSMQAKAARAKAVFRPHFKTHQSAVIGQWFADEGVKAITVSSVDMAEYFAAHGWDDITIAFLLNPLQWTRIEALANEMDSRGGRLGLTIDSIGGARFISSQRETPLRIWIKIDTGYGRTGVSWNDHFTLKNIMEILGTQNKPQGLLTHSGHSYHAESTIEIEEIWSTTCSRMVKASEGLEEYGPLLLSVGDTPCCRWVDDLSGVQEIRPGNFVFFDLMQLKLGVCGTQELALAMVCPVVGVYPERGHVVIHGGAVHFSKEFLTGSDGQPVYGFAGTVQLREDGSICQNILEDMPLISLSQEHGTLKTNPESRCLEIGDLVLVWPVHSCLTCDLASELRTLTGSAI